MNDKPIINLINNKYPFGEIDKKTLDIFNNTYIYDRVSYKTELQKDQLCKKIKILKQIVHPNLIAIKSIKLSAKQLHIFYQYVHQSIQTQQLITTYDMKQFHKQFIMLIIQLAKNSIITKFDPSRCGIIHKNGQKFIKYFVPFNQITICYVRNTIERNVQLFTVKSLQYLDQLICIKSSISQAQTQRTVFQSQSLIQSRQKIQSSHKLKKNVFKPNQLLVNRKLSYRFEQSNKKKLKDYSLSFRKTMYLNSEQKQHKSYYSSIQKYLSVKQALIQRIKNIKNRSKKALNRFKQVNTKLKISLKKKNNKTY